MFLQGIAILIFPFTEDFIFMVTIAFLLGVGTALVYPTFLSAIATATNPTQRAESIGAFRFWRDSGYAIGAVLSGIIADLLGVSFAISMIGMITLFSAVVIKVRMPEYEESNSY
jgi:predicted MFS family arabinose efflux permease